MVRVTTSSLGYRHTCEHAQFLERLGLLDVFIHAYPSYYVRGRFEIPNRHSVSLLTLGVLHRVLLKAYPHLNVERCQRLMQIVHIWFARSVASRIALTSNIVSGMSSYMVEPIQIARKRGIISVVEHGSLHQRVEQRLLEEESELWGLPRPNDIPSWLIDREDEEFQTADSVVVQSWASWNSLVQEGVSPEKLFLNPLGVDLSFFNPEGPEEQDGVFRVIHVGSLIARKGIQYLIRAFHELNLPNSELIFVGIGYETSAIRPVLDRYAADNIKFLGKIPRADLPVRYRQSSVFVLPSIADGFAAVVTEAMACGTTVIVTKNVGSADMVREGETGFVVPIRDVEALKEKLLVLYNDRERCRQMGLAARRSVESGNGWEEHSARLLEHYKRLKVDIP
jgi:glycosyltransferase involved in cell wall biosynthesis